MTSTLESKMGILSVVEAISIFEERYPNNDWNKLQIEHEGPFMKYEMVGNDGEKRNRVEINAHTGTVIKDKQKSLKAKAKDSSRRERKKLNMKDLLPLTQVNRIAQEQARESKPFQWELDRQKERTVWKIEFADANGEQIFEYKIDAQDGSIIQMKRKR